MATAPIAPSTIASITSTPFVNEAFVDFSAPENKRAMEAALAAVENTLGREYDIIIGGRRLQTAGKIISTNPARPAQVIGVHRGDGAEHVEDAMQAEKTAFAGWSRTSIEERVGLLFRAAELIRGRKLSFARGVPLE